ncbi:MAG: hypothetical protein AB3N21_01165 [Ruegeria sp.]|uniref:hypothetical protein n=1 Tax=Ruegeria sp. TaxID=1879320 RepID=UPI00349E58B8
MRYATLDIFLKTGAGVLAKGPVAMVFVEDDVEVEATLHHHLDRGFKTVLAFMPDAFQLPEEVEAQIHRISFQCGPREVVVTAINQIIDAAPGIWMYYCYNAEFLFHPFCESRTVGEMLAFHTEERRDAMLAYVIDLYAADLNAHPNAVSRDEALLDRSGYYAQSRWDTQNNCALDRQLDFFGGVRWRFEEHIPFNSRKIDRIALFKSKPGLKLLANHTFNEPEYNTYACPWHHNLTAAICSFRTAKALKRNPGSAFEIQSFRWRNSVPFDWTSGQLLDLGLMEPGQWF